MSGQIVAGFYVCGVSKRNAYADPAHVVMRRPGAGDPVHCSPGETRRLAQALLEEADRADPPARSGCRCRNGSLLCECPA